MIELGPCEITALFGPMASGKTYQINQWLKENNRFVRFDATGESMDDPGVEHIWRSPRALYERIKSNPYYFRIAYHPGQSIVEDFYYCIQCLWRFDVDKTVVCDEFHEVCNVSDTPRFVQTMMRYARHDKLAVIGASQRIADVSKLFTSGARQIVIFWTQEARDLDAVAQRWGTNAEEMVANLRPLVYDDISGKASQFPQCLVIRKGQKPRVYDYQTNSFTTGSTRSSDTREDGEEVQREGGDDSPDERKRENGNRVPQDREDPDPAAIRPTGA